MGDFRREPGEFGGCLSLVQRADRLGWKGPFALIFCFGLCRSSFGFKRQALKGKGKNKRALGSVLTIGQH